MSSSFYTFQDIIHKLHEFWTLQGCLILHPFDVEKGAGTMSPHTFLRVLGDKDWNCAYVEPSRRPTDGRYADNPNRGENILKILGLFYQSATVKKFMVIFFIWFCLTVFKQTCVSRQIYFFLVTSTTEEIGRHNFKGLGNVINPLSHKVSRIRN